MNEDKKICGYDVCPEVGEHEKCPMNPKNRIKNPDYQEGFLAGQKQERERILAFIESQKTPADQCITGFPCEFKNGALMVVEKFIKDNE